MEKPSLGKVEQPDDAQRSSCIFMKRETTASTYELLNIHQFSYVAQHRNEIQPRLLESLHSRMDLMTDALKLMLVTVQDRPR